MPSALVVWEYYKSLLEIIAATSEFETHKLTEYYEQVIQANLLGSRWMLSMTLASAGEGIAKVLMSPQDRQREFSKEELADVTRMIKFWEGNKELKAALLSAIGGLNNRSVRSFLQKLVRQDILESEHEKAWTRVRNSVMHGNLVTRWSTQEDDVHLIDLAQLVHRLTREVVRRYEAEKVIQTKADHD